MYVKEFCPIKVASGKLMFTLLVSYSKRTQKSVYFEVWNNQNEWKVYWNFEMSSSEYLPIMAEVVNSKTSFREAMQNKEVLSKIAEHSVNLSAPLIDSEAEIVRQFSEQRLCKIDNRASGLDGKSIRVAFPDDDEYYCWMMIPDEWKNLREVIDLFFDKAEIELKF